MASDLLNSSKIKKKTENLTLEKSVLHYFSNFDIFQKHKKLVRFLGTLVPTS